ncbi:hypothetical protein [Flavobacterium sp. GT3R68]|uniref:hypothetical protein n=1 Tax=Flavobacterium sp. GT3R68 TaxID=2594437 RepID=UPI000F89A0FF|nr:hypothetical protein [Flavobacterium sp. GT3R68]RTY95320.1 hypothetical protein EKL32_07770 [Flavobacterium sp. GSN2]TRW90940.1 hypothetical protein FNW07_08900 [Flavobacterium sp. GT3R68]
MKRLRILTFFSVLLAGSIFFLKKTSPTTIVENEGLTIKKEWLSINKNSITPKKDVRPADQTFLTFTEWYLVFSPEEQANYFKHHTASSFPFMSHTAQIWEGYNVMNDQIKGNFPPNEGYQFMIWVIGTSASVEYSIKAWYETIIGRITDTDKVFTDEDQLNAKFTQDYVDFIKDRPWYEFDFKSRLKSLWGSTSIFDNHFARKMERKYILTSELLVKIAYGKLIGLGTEKVYDETLPTTLVALDSPSTQNLMAEKRNQTLVDLPRYDKFNGAICKLAYKGYRFKEIAGNNSAILVTVLSPINKTLNLGNAQIVFEQPISSDLKMQRIAVAIPVPELNTLLIQLNKDHIKVEHIFDF